MNLNAIAAGNWISIYQFILKKSETSGRNAEMIQAYTIGHIKIADGQRIRVLWLTAFIRDTYWSCFEFTKDIAYLALMGDLLGVLFEFKENVRVIREV